MRQGFGKGAIGHQRIQAARQQQPALYGAQLQDLQRLHPRRQQRCAAQVDHHHHLLRIPHRQQLLLAQGVEHPDTGGQHNGEHTSGVGAKGGQQLLQALVEEQPEACQQDQQPYPLPHTEALAKNEHTGHQQQHRPQLHHQLRGTRAEQLQADQIQHVIAHQAQHRHPNQAPALGREPAERRQAAVGRQPGAQQSTGHQQAIPGHRQRVHHLQHLLELDRQDAPQQRCQQGKQQAVNPTAGGGVHGVLDQIRGGGG